MNINRQNNRGFTLIELLVVVAIIGILAAVGVVAYNGYTNAAKKNATKTIHANVMKFIAAEYQKCSIDSSDKIMKKGGAGGLDCSTATAGMVTAGQIVDHLTTAASTPFEDRNPWVTGEAAVVKATTAAAGKVSLSADGDNVVKILTCFTDGKTDNPCTGTDADDNTLANTVTID